MMSVGSIVAFRIIPARAGFTDVSCEAGTAPGDHPRSRGVYERRRPKVPRTSGSSPLARGLRDPPTGAGTTKLAGSTGSSPLARGLHPPQRSHQERLRIIPARAGFTLGTRTGVRARPDHPRSRGVYRLPTTRPRQASGSSPLARGLRLHVDERPGHDRIIPARAGFTEGMSVRAQLIRDHPRSRGVYQTALQSMYWNQGSSPLARGLPGGRAGCRCGRRIIPARAGFTPVHPCCHGARRDHPRSRGVYEEQLSLRAATRGSSPLARGLPLRPHQGVEGRRIIPARAGFTRTVTTSTGLRGDHPRSRGVYAESQVGDLAVLGSSPLARGLPGEGHGDGVPVGIIPARAGFTCGSRPPGGRRWDHPRSRGVYQAIDASDATNKGSSPLARGLQKKEMGVPKVEGIIPARAGFT